MYPPNGVGAPPDRSVRYRVRPEGSHEISAC
jgi:hypothetical protein